jgi:putative lipoprotein
MKRLCLVAASALALFVCQLPSLAQAQDTNSVTGTLSYRERMALPDTATIRVVLADVSLADAPETVIAEQSFASAGKQVPFDFSLAYDPSKIEDKNSYAVRAEITVDGQLWFTTTSHYGVITQGNPTSGLALMLERTSTGESNPSTGESNPSTPPSGLPQTGGGSGFMPLLLIVALLALGAGRLALRRA